MTRESSRRLAVISCGVALLGGGLWSLAYLDRPHGQDHGIFAWVGDVIRAGGMPYRDAWDIKGPAPYLLFAALQALFGGTSVALRVFDLAILALGGVLLHRVARRSLPEPWSFAPVLVGALWYASGSYENTAQPDGWAAVAILAVVSLLRPTAGAGTGRLVGVGALLGVCCLLKPTFVLCATIPAAALLGRGAGAARPLALVALGLALPIAAAGTWLAANGAIGHFIDIHLRYTASIYAGGGGGTSVLTGFRRFFVELAASPAFALGFVGALVGLVAEVRARPHLGWMLAAWLGSTLTIVALGGKFFPYHWLPLYPPVALLAVVGAHSVAPLIVRRLRLRPWWTHAAIAGAVLVLGASSARRIARETVGWWRTAAQPAQRTEYERASFGPEGRHPGSLVAVAAYLRTHTASDDRVQMFGQDALVYHLSGRLPPTRFGISQPLLSGSGDRFRGRYRREFLEGFAGRTPTYAVARRAELCQAGKHRGLLDCLSEWPELQTLVDSLYLEETTIGDYALFRLRSAEVRPAERDAEGSRP